MEIREAHLADRPAIRDVARRSLQASYSIDTTAIVDAVDEWYDENRLRDRIGNEDTLLLLAVRDGQVVGFSDSTITGDDTGKLSWIHVDPNYRSADVGETLFQTTRDRLSDRGATHLHGRVLADNVGGNEFYKDHGLVKVGEETVSIQGASYTENVYAEPAAEGLEAVATDDRTVYIDRTTRETGSIAPFHIVYVDESAQDIYGYWCTNCEDFANAMDPMGRIQCDACGNTRKPERWDAAYL